MISCTAVLLSASSFWTGHYTASILLLLAVALNALVSAFEVAADPHAYRSEAASAGVSVEPKQTVAVQLGAVGVLCVLALSVARVAGYL